MPTMRQQYQNIKNDIQNEIKLKCSESNATGTTTGNNRNILLFFKLGNFYEAFYEDAQIISKELCMPSGFRIDDVGAKINHWKIEINQSQEVFNKLHKAGYKTVILTE